MSPKAFLESVSSSLHRQMLTIRTHNCTSWHSLSVTRCDALAAPHTFIQVIRSTSYTLRHQQTAKSTQELVQFVGDELVYVNPPHGEWTIFRYILPFLCEIENCKLLRCTMLNKNYNQKSQWSLYVPPVVIICTASGHYTYRKVQHLKILRSAYTVYVFCVDLRTHSYYFPIQH
jgi:hypothetical protein